MARELKKKTNFELISLDWMFGASLKNRPKYVKNILDSFKDKYPEIKNKKNYYEFSDEIYNFLLKNISESVIFEGRHIYRYINPNVLKGRVIIKRTCLINSYKRALKRDMNNKIKEYKNNEINIIKVISRFYERIKIPIKDYILINNYIFKLAHLNKKTIKNIKQNRRLMSTIFLFKERCILCFLYSSNKLYRKIYLLLQNKY